MAFIDTRQLAEREPKPGWHGRFFDSEGMSFAVYRIDAGASLHEHAHPNEEVWNVISGELEITIGGDSHRAGPGCAALVPPNTAHSIRVLKESSVIVVDRPLRGAVGGTGRAALAIRFTSAVDVVRASGDTRVAIPFEVRNLGRSAATLRRIDMESGVASELPPPTRTATPDGALPERIAIAAGGAHAAIHEHPPLSLFEREQIGAGKAVFYLRGAVFYEDAEGERHHTTFCRVFDREHGLIEPHRPGYNYGD